MSGLAAGEAGKGKMGRLRCVQYVVGQKNEGISDVRFDLSKEKCRMRGIDKRHH